MAYRQNEAMLERGDVDVGGILEELQINHSLTEYTSVCTEPVCAKMVRQ